METSASSSTACGTEASTICSTVHCWILSGETVFGTSSNYVIISGVSTNCFIVSGTGPSRICSAVHCKVRYWLKCSLSRLDLDTAVSSMDECFAVSAFDVSSSKHAFCLVSDEVSPSNRLINSVIEPFTFSSTKRPSPALMESSTTRFRGPPCSATM